jgi:hypothetical protein
MFVFITLTSYTTISYVVLRDRDVCVESLLYCSMPIIYYNYISLCIESSQRQTRILSILSFFFITRFVHERIIHFAIIEQNIF